MSPAVDGQVRGLGTLQDLGDVIGGQRVVFNVFKDRAAVGGTRVDPPRRWLLVENQNTARRSASSYAAIVREQRAATRARRY